ncbi:MAG: glycosyltransferase [Deltaproteobacteria bacterium]|nr:MAG: glycosyltransferase [Deltaproteobacteria bacterium]
MRPEVSVAIPMHNEEGNVELLYHELKEVMEGLRLRYEIIFVNDGSTDRTGELLRGIASRDEAVRVVELDGNFGEAAALSAGYQFAQGDWIITMDGDGQNDPRDIPALLEMLRKGYKAVSGWRRKRKEDYLSRVLPSRVVNWLIALVTGVKIHDVGCGLKGYRASLVKGHQIPHGFHRFLPALFGVKDEEVAEVEVKDRRRRSGRSHYGLGRTFEVIRELLTVRFAISDAEGWRRRIHKARGAISLGGLAVLILLLFSFNLGTLILLLALVVLLSLCRLVERNLLRFLRAQEEGVFRVREVVNG